MTDDERDEILGGPMPLDDPNIPPIVGLPPDPNEIITGTFDPRKLSGELLAADLLGKVRGFYETGVEIDPLLSAEDRAALKRVLDAHVP